MNDVRVLGDPFGHHRYGGILPKVVERSSTEVRPRDWLVTCQLQAMTLAIAQLPLLHTPYNPANKTPLQVTPVHAIPTPSQSSRTRK
jgi:hypothetical protein